MGPMTVAPQILGGPFLYSFYFLFIFLPLYKVCRDRELLSQQRINVARQPSVVTILVARVVLCRVRAQSVVVVCPGPVVTTLSGPDCAMSRHDFQVKTQTRSRPRKSGHDMETSSHDQALSRHEILCCNNELPYNDQVLSQHKTVCRDIELFSLNDILSRPRNPLPRPNPVATQYPLSQHCQDRELEILSHQRKPCCDISTACHLRTMSRHKDPCCDTEPESSVVTKKPLSRPNTCNSLPSLSYTSNPYSKHTKFHL